MYINTSKTTSLATARKFGIDWIVEDRREFFNALADEWMHSYHSTGINSILLGGDE
jgi:hypothetical protein